MNFITKITNKYKVVATKDYGPKDYETSLELWKDGNKVFAYMNKKNVDITKVFGPNDSLTWLEGSTEKKPYEVDLLLDIDVDPEGPDVDFTKAVMSHKGTKDIDISDICDMPDFIKNISDSAIEHWFDVYNQKEQYAREAYEAEQEDRWREGHLAKKYGYGE